MATIAEFRPDLSRSRICFKFRREYPIISGMACLDPLHGICTVQLNEDEFEFLLLTRTKWAKVQESVAMSSAGRRLRRWPWMEQSCKSSNPYRDISEGDKDRMTRHLSSVKKTRSR